MTFAIGGTLISHTLAHSQLVPFSSNAAVYTFWEEIKANFHISIFFSWRILGSSFSLAGPIPL